MLAKFSFEWENSLLLWIQNNLRSDWLNPIMKGITYLAENGGIWLLLSLILIIIPKTRRLGIVCASSLGMAFLVNNIIIKNVVERIRPYEAIEGLQRIIEKQSDYSFPSGHTSASFSVAVVLFLETPKKIGIPAIIVACLVALSRLYVGVHYPTDIIAAAIFSSLIAVACCMFYHKITKK